jgi:hypothetical protein
MSFFPNAAGAPRLSSPSKRSVGGFYTPYFSTFSFAGLFEAGEADFCVNQFEQAWGWALTQVGPLVQFVFRVKKSPFVAAKRITTGFATYTKTKPKPNISGQTDYLGGVWLVCHSGVSLSLSVRFIGTSSLPAKPITSCCYARCSTAGIYVGGSVRPTLGAGAQLGRLSDLATLAVHAGSLATVRRRPPPL